MFFLDSPSRVIRIKTKLSKWDQIKFKRFCIAKETINKKERQPTEWESICKHDGQGVNLLNKPTAHEPQYKKKTNWKMDRRSKQTFLHRRHTDVQKARDVQHH